MIRIHIPHTSINVHPKKISFGMIASSCFAGIQSFTSIIHLQDMHDVVPNVD